MMRLSGQISNANNSPKGCHPKTSALRALAQRIFAAGATVATVVMTIFAASGPIAAMPNTGHSADGNADGNIAPRFIQILTQQGITALTDATLEPLERRAAMRETFISSFATEEIARLALGRYWGTARDEEKELFIEALAIFVANAVVDNLPTTGHFEIFTSIEIDSPDTGSRRFEVNTVLVTDHFSSPVTWTINVAGDTPKVLDLVINNRSFLQSQKTEFAAILRRNGGSIEDLIEQISF